MSDSTKVTNRSLHQVWLMLEQWSSLDLKSGSPLGNAFAEALLCLLNRAFNALCAELAAGCGYRGECAQLEQVCAELAAQGQTSPELMELLSLAQAPRGWLSQMLHARVRYEDTASGALTIAVGGGLDAEQCRDWHRHLSQLAARLRESSAHW
ncbi:DUF6586 family protein [Aestuariirhabdus litorea]|uniref:Uncharacterized protein n=1 Tax=Aestuariirhabdus litorea TaxID=2528527 RepID=A0A3P3VQR1_9GAMM|nr:DUF6586 family protein [Aestuariirhabdus litorea]RRJ84657.1 hypothetical protein D0544_06020 [Aestuariirhabdus litorea]RWW97881.1 hypothetical protein DZC74_06015 [Endozoicomonadaceae bacterium GTF-13]